jgi:hypothetical protein
MKQAGNLTIQHPDVGTSLVVPVHDLSAATPADLVAYLTRRGSLPSAESKRPYELFAGGRALVMGRSFLDNGLTGDAELQVLRATHGA